MGWLRRFWRRLSTVHCSVCAGYEHAIDDLERAGRHAAAERIRQVRVGHLSDVHPEWLGAAVDGFVRMAPDQFAVECDRRRADDGYPTRRGGVW